VYIFIVCLINQVLIYYKIVTFSLISISVKFSLSLITLISHYSKVFIFARIISTRSMIFVIQVVKLANG